MKNSRKIKKRFLALLGCAALGAVLAPAALAAEDLAAPAAGDPFRQYSVSYTHLTLPTILRV